MTRTPWKVAAAVVAGMALSWSLSPAPASGASQAGADPAGLARFQR